MNRYLLALACLAALTVAACSQQPAAPSNDATPAVASPPPTRPGAPDVTAAREGPAPDFDQRGFAGTFAGTVPCADCPGIDVTVTLQGDGTYRISNVYQERPDSAWGMDGHWTVEADNTVIRLDPNSKTEADQLFAIQSQDRIVMLDADGQRSDNGLDYSLSRQAAP